MTGSKNNFQKHYTVDGGNVVDSCRQCVLGLVFGHCIVMFFVLSSSAILSLRKRMLVPLQYLHFAVRVCFC